ncbi:MAG: hypothetical protein GXN93_00715 [Candidatus Diapherotrites archaeon]|nr:hypothetical protein [Candidatus Diapherotrites archaeon]
MMLWVVIAAGISGLLAGIAATAENGAISRSAAVIAGAILGGASTNPSVATVAVGIAAGKLPIRGRGQTSVALGVATYLTAYVLMNEHIYILPAIIVAIVATLDEIRGKWTRGLTLPATLVAISPLIGCSGPAAAGMFCAALGATGLLIQTRKSAHGTPNNSA